MYFNNKSHQPSGDRWFNPAHRPSKPLFPPFPSFLLGQGEGLPSPYPALKLPPLTPWRSCTDFRVLVCGGVSQELCWGECRRSEGVNARCRGKVTKKMCNGGAFGPKSLKREPKRAEGSQKGAKREPSGAKSEPKGAKREPKGAKREPKGSPNGAIGGSWGAPGGSSGQNIKKKRRILTILGSILATFWHQFGTISGVCRIILRCVAVCREVLCCDHLGSPSRRVAVCCGTSCRVVSRKTRNARNPFLLEDSH